MNLRARDAAAARIIVGTLLAQGYAVSVYDGEEYTVKRSQDAGEILEALGTTDSDQLAVRKPGRFERLFTLVLVWGNDGECYADAAYSSDAESTQALEAFDAEVMPRLDALVDARNAEDVALLRELGIEV